ncbi:hypothetical protein Vadar_027953 [Vaccinium darrowii]|uniref:Uncharacterized protein n=1 Tax=Vaccinium darrowii TaxID=229202 RepID=A0ACB7ZFD9_9ERIC|nr:hypothetical protein Vadar_027953 [Vaccinium darrowii]
MAALGTRLMVLAFVVTAGILNSGDNLVSGQCRGDLNGLMSQCAAFVQKPGPKVNPSGECCKVVKSVDVPCVCGHIPKEAEQIISMDKAVYVAEFCGIPLRHGMKCGTSLPSPSLATALDRFDDASNSTVDGLTAYSNASNSSPKEGTFADMIDRALAKEFNETDQNGDVDIIRPQGVLINPWIEYYALARKKLALCHSNGK